MISRAREPILGSVVGVCCLSVCLCFDHRLGFLLISNYTCVCVCSVYVVVPSIVACFFLVFLGYCNWVSDV